LHDLSIIGLKVDSNQPRKSIDPNALECGAKKREKLTAAAVFCQFLDKSRERLEKADISDWSDADLLAANASVTALQEVLGIFLNPSPAKVAKCRRVGNWRESSSKYPYT